MCARVVDLVARLRETATVSYDPNIRPAIMRSTADVLGRVEARVALSDVVRASDADLYWPYPGMPLRRLSAGGSTWALCSRCPRGPLGAYAVLRASQDHLVVPQGTVTLADTVGAGDSFMPASCRA
jgi:fructokinase